MPKKDINKKIIITADDFGLAEGINRGILKAYENGAITSASLVANGRAFESAVEMVKRSGLDVGVHLTFLEEKPVSDLGDVRSIVRPGGFFLNSIPQFVAKVYLDRNALGHVMKEARAQIEKILQTGLRISFLNSHRHVHMLPVLFGRLVSLAKEYGIRAVRLPNERLLKRHFLSSFKNLLFFPPVLFLKELAVFQAGRLRRRGFQCLTCSTGILSSGRLDEKYLLSLLDALPDGTSEIFSHPGTFESSMAPYRRWGYRWQNELDALLSPAVRERLKDRGIKPVSFRDFLQEA